MPASIRPLLSLLLLTTATVAVGATRSDWWAALLQPDRLPRPAHSATEELQPPTLESIYLAKRIAAKTRIIQLLHTGEMNLFQAAAWFRYLNTEGDSAQYFPNLLPGASVEEKMCRQVIHWLVCSRRGHSPDAELRAMQRRLEAELTAHMARHGKVVLPEM